MKEKGFTLIELLAVIVILAIIALIATPIILGIIEDASDESIERSVENYLKAVNIAVAKENLNREFNPNTCEVQSTGNLLCNGEELIVEVDGNHPKSGTIVFTNGNVSGYENLFINEQYANKGSNGVVVTNDKKYICEPVTVATTGNVPSGNYAYGDEYLCDPGDGVRRTFFVLENGDNTTLTKSDGSLHYETDLVGTTGRGEVSLLMSSNLGNAVHWCLSGNDSSCNASGSRAELANVTINWRVEVNLPTYAQIVQANDGSWTGLKEWMKNGDYYATSTAYSGGGVYSVVPIMNFIQYSTFPSPSHGYIRPVITISKDQIG